MAENNKYYSKALTAIEPFYSSGRAHVITLSSLLYREYITKLYYFQLQIIIKIRIYHSPANTWGFTLDLSFAF